MMVFIPHHEQKPGGVQYHFMLETSLPFSIISYWKRLVLASLFCARYNTVPEGSRHWGRVSGDE
jgi:hypothetical protein